MDYIDLLITDNDITLDPAGVPVMTQDRDSIAQDLAHMIRDSGLLVEIIANRDAQKRQTNMVRITLLVDGDTRIVPGSARISESRPGTYWLTAKTVKYGDIGFEMGATQ